MFIPLNDTVELLVSSSSSILTDPSDQCETIGHCRTVWNIIWSCLVTIFACIWVAIHPNVPQPKSPRKPVLEAGYRPRRWSLPWVRYQIRMLGRYLADLLRYQLTDTLSGLDEKIGIALLALLAPEFIFAWALRQWLRARSIAKKCRKAASTEAAMEGRRQKQNADKAYHTARRRAELDYLDRLGYAGRSFEQDITHGELRIWNQMFGPEIENEYAIEEESNNQTGEERLYAYRKA